MIQYDCGNYWLYCDNCGETGIGEETEKRVIGWAENQGWQGMDSKDYCPRCLADPTRANLLARLDAAEAVCELVTVAQVNAAGYLENASVEMFERIEKQIAIWQFVKRKMTK
jgi:hypothetical protein